MASLRFPSAALGVRCKLPIFTIMHRGCASISIEEKQTIKLLSETNHGSKSKHDLITERTVIEGTKGRQVLFLCRLVQDKICGV